MFRNKMLGVVQLLIDQYGLISLSLSLSLSLYIYIYIESGVFRFLKGIFIL